MYVLAQAVAEDQTVDVDNYLVAGAAFVISVVLALLSKKTLTLATKKLALEKQVVNIFSRLLAIVFLGIGAFYVLTNLGVRVGPLLGTLGIGGVALAFALQNLVINLLGSVLIHARKPFRQGDQVEILGNKGTVIDVNTRTVVLLTFEGTHLHIPNSKVMDDPFINRTREPSRRTSMNISVSYNTDLERALRTVQAAIRECEGVVNPMLAEAHVVNFGDNGIDITYRFWHPSEQLEANQVISSVAIAIHNAFNREGIEIPYPQLVVHQ